MIKLTNILKEESYVERMKSEIHNIESKYPGCKELIEKFKKINNMSGMDYDYSEEPLYMKYKAIEEFAKKLNGL